MNGYKYIDAVNICLGSVEHPSGIFHVDNPLPFLSHLFQVSKISKVARAV